MERNKELFYKIAERIEKDPISYYQSNWATLVMNVNDPENPFAPDYIEGVDDLYSFLKDPDAVDEDGNDIIDLVSAEDVPEHSCGTAYCIAGHAMVESGWKTVWEADGDYGQLQWHDPKGNLAEDVEFEAEAGALLGIYDPETGRVDRTGGEYPIISIFSGGWKPRAGLTVPEALRMLGDGASYEAVTFDIQDED